MMTSGTNLHSRYHPDYLCLILYKVRDHFRLPTKSYPVTGATGFHYWKQTASFTEPTQEPDCSGLPHRLTPTAGSLELSSGANFPSTSFCILVFCHLTTTDGICQSVENDNFRIRVNWNFVYFLTVLFGENVWLFTEHMVDWCQYFKRQWRRRFGRTYLQRVSGWCKLTDGRRVTHHFRAGVSSATH